jgi:hypothetical protein
MTIGRVLKLSGKRKLSKIAASETIVSALIQMRKNNHEQLLIEPVDHERPLLVTGYSVISRLLETKPGQFASFLKSPCLLYCLSGGTIGKDSDLQSLLHVYEATTFGFAMVHDEINQIFSKISVVDLLALFSEGILSSDISIQQVASSPAFLMSRGSTILECMREMEKRKFRRVRIAGGSSVVSDAELFSYLFDEKRLEIISRTPQHLLDGTLEDVDPIQGMWIDDKENISKAARIMLQSKQQFLLTDNGIVTPWDLTLKPWRLGALRIAQTLETQP